MFKLINTSKTFIYNDDHNDSIIRTWKSLRQHDFIKYLCDDFYLNMINLYLQECSNDELNSLFGTDYFLRINCYHSENLDSYIQMACLKLSNISNLDCKQALKDVPKDRTPCVIQIDTVWVMFGIYKTMILCKKLPEKIYVNNGVIYSMKFFSRSALPQEIEENNAKIISN